MSAATPVSRRSGLRVASWLLGAASLVLPVVWFVGQSYAYEPPARGIPGLRTLGVMLQAAILAIGSSAMASLCGWLAYLALSSPRPKRRLAECALVGAVCEATLLACAAAMLVGAWD